MIGGLASRVTLLIGGLLIFFDLIVDQPANKPSAGSDRGAKAGIAGDRSDNRTARGAAKRTGRGTLLCRTHVGAAAEQADSYDTNHDFLHDNCSR